MDLDDIKWFESFEALPPDDADTLVHQDKAQLSAELDKAMADFIARGGAIQQCSVADTAMSRGYTKAAEAESMARNNENIKKRAQKRKIYLIEFLREMLDKPKEQHLHLYEICAKTKSTVYCIRSLLRSDVFNSQRAKEIASEKIEKSKTLSVLKLKADTHRTAQGRTRVRESLIVGVSKIINSVPLDSYITINDISIKLCIPTTLVTAILKDNFNEFLNSGRVVGRDIEYLRKVLREEYPDNEAAQAFLTNENKSNPTKGTDK